MSQLTSSVAKNAAYQVIGKAVSILLGAVSFGIIARSLGHASFGNYTTITTFAIFFSTMADMGFYLIAMREMSKPRVDEARVFSHAFTLRLIATLFFVGLAPVVAWAFFGYSREIEIGILVASLSTLFVSLTQILVAIFQKYLATAHVATTEVVGRVVFLAGVVWLASWTQDVVPFLWMMGIASATTCLLLYAASRKFMRFRLAYDPDEWRRILRLSWPVGLAIIINLFYFRFNIVLLSLMRPAEDVGIFGAAYKIIEILAALPAIFVGLVIPLLSKYFTADRARFVSIFERSFNALILIAIPIAVGTQFIAKWVVVLVGGNGFESSGAVLQVLIIGTFAMFLSALATDLCVVINRQKTMIFVSCVAAITSVVLNLVLVPRYSYMGTAIAAAVTEGVIAIASFSVIYAAIKMRPRLVVFGKALFAGAVMGAVLYVVPPYNALVTILLGAVAYGAVVVLTRAVTMNDVRGIFQMTRQKNE